MTWQNIERAQSDDSDQHEHPLGKISLRCALNGQLRTQSSFMWTAKTQIRLNWCQRRSYSSHDTHTHCWVSHVAAYNNEPVHDISNNVLCATSKGSDQPAHTHSLFRSFARRLSILWELSYWLYTTWGSKLKMRLQRLVRVYTCQNVKLLEISCRGPIFIQNEQHRLCVYNIWTQINKKVSSSL